eukprot:3331977-Rhodomonas_salina.2
MPPYNQTQYGWAGLGVWQEKSERGPASASSRSPGQARLDHAVVFGDYGKSLFASRACCEERGRDSRNNRFVAA